MNNPYPHKRRVAGAFTLIELLVVIAIIAVLAAILFPVFAIAREKARQTSCLSNEKQLGLALIQYTDDNDDLLPVGDPFFSPYSTGRGWAARIYPYVKSTAVYHCPSDPTTDTKGLNGLPGEIDYTVSYGINYDLTGGYRSFAPPGTSTDPVHPPMSQLRASASTVLLFETQGTHQWLTNPTGDYSANSFYNSSAGGCGGDGGAGFINVASTNSTDVNLTAKYATGFMGQPERRSAYDDSFTRSGRHTDGSNFLLADGHAKFLPRQLVSPGMTNSNPACDQDHIGNPCIALAGIAAGTESLGKAPKNFVATFSPF